MDTEELEEIAFHRKNGRPETTRGPYYHKTWWESYKGAVKGILGGIVVGGMIGAIAGGAILGTLALTGAGSVVAEMGGIILAATTAFGMYEGKEKFEKVGITTGAIAAAEEISEVRMKEYLREKTTGITNEIRELKAAFAGKIGSQDMHTDIALPDDQPIFNESDFRSTHQSSEDPHEEHSNKLVYWNVAAIGAAVGATVAAVAGLASEGVPHFVGEVMSSTFGGQVSAATANTAMIASGAALGGTFGVSRDIFRKIFDVTDCWFMGVADGKCSNEAIAQAKGHAFESLEPPHPRVIEEAYALPQPAQQALDGRTLIDPQSIQKPSPEVSNARIIGPQSTYFQDKLESSAAKAALLGMDHTSARMH